MTMSDSPGQKVNVTATAVQLFPNLDGPWFIRFENLDAAIHIYVGDSTVTEPAGANEGAQFSGGAVGVRAVFNPAGAVVNPENIWAVCASGQNADVATFAVRSAN